MNKFDAIRNIKLKSLTYCFAFCVFLICFPLTFFAQNIDSKLETENFVTRGGVFYGLNAGLTFKKVDLLLGTGFQWGNMIKSQFFTPHITAGVNYLLVKEEKLQLGLGLRYMYTWRRQPFNQTASSHSLYYGYRLTYGSKWYLSHNLGVGGMMRSDFPNTSMVLLDVNFSLGFGYAF